MAGSRELVELVLDEGSWESWDTPPPVDDLDPDYRAALQKAAQSGRIAPEPGGGWDVDALPEAPENGATRPTFAKETR